MEPMPCCGAQYPRREGNQATAIGGGSASAPGERHPGHAKADRVIGGIAEEIERVGLQASRFSRRTRQDLGCEEAGIYDERDPERTPPFW
jgi:hypothetical protein